MSNDPISIDIDEIIATVAKKQQILLTKDDPVLLTATINEHVLDIYLNKVQSELKILTDSLNSIYLEQEKQAAKVVKTIMDECLLTAQTALEKAAHKASEDIKTALRTQQNLIVVRNEKIAQDIKNSRNITFISAIATLCCTAIVMVVFLT